MKRIIVLILSSLFVSMCTAQRPLTEADKGMFNEAKELSQILGIPLDSSSLNWAEPFFPAEGTVSMGATHIIRQGIHKPNAPLGGAFDFVVTNGNSKAFGSLWQRASYKDAHNALMFDLVCCNMPAKLIAAYNYKIYPSEIGDFCIIRTKTDAIANTRTEVPSALHFVRGNIAISLQGVDDADVRPIAKVLDGFLKQPPEKRKPTAPPAPQAPDTKK